ncbi:hypothetical protein SNEBB_004052 [Seison nebaliae]|nr:hypothetical protein SNEBB_004052 [Seison nebaliae]
MLESEIIKSNLFTNLNWRQFAQKLHDEEDRLTTLQIDIMMCNLSLCDEMDDIDYILKLFNKLKKNKQFLNWREKNRYSYAFIRSLMDIDLTSTLVNKSQFDENGLLLNKFQFGFHTNFHSSTLLLNRMLTEEQPNEKLRNYNAMMIAADRMLNEKSDKNISQMLSFIASSKYLVENEEHESLMTNEKFVEESRKKNEEKPMLKVNWKRNCNLDEHFHLLEADEKDGNFRRLSGKSLSYFAQQLTKNYEFDVKQMNLLKNLQIIGYCSMDKIEMVNKIMKENNLKLYESSLKFIESMLFRLNDANGYYSPFQSMNERFGDWWKPELDLLEKHVKYHWQLSEFSINHQEKCRELLKEKNLEKLENLRNDLDELVDGRLRIEIKSKELEEMNRMKEMYKKWNTDRNESYENKKKEDFMKKELKEIRHELKLLEEEEDRLYFFDNQQTINSYSYVDWNDVTNVEKFDEIQLKRLKKRIERRIRSRNRLLLYSLDLMTLYNLPEYERILHYMKRKHFKNYKNEPLPKRRIHKHARLAQKEYLKEYFFKDK